MTAQKAVPAKTALPTAAPAITTRKAWVKKTPVDIVLDQIRKQEERVSGMRAELAREERGLAKLQKAKEALEEK